jgi:hypothetical protein
MTMDVRADDEPAGKAGIGAIDHEAGVKVCGAWQTLPRMNLAAPC